MYDQLHRHPAASMMEKTNLGRLSVPEENVLSAAQEREESFCSGDNHVKATCNVLNVLCRAQLPAQDRQKLVRNRHGGYLLSANWTAYKMERASRIMTFSYRKKSP